LEARQLLSRVLLGVDGSSFRLRHNEPFMVAGLSAFILLEKITAIDNSATG